MFVLLPYWEILWLILTLLTLSIGITRLVILYRKKKSILSAISTILLGFLFCFGYWSSGTHFVIQIGQKGLIVNKTFTVLENGSHRKEFFQRVLLFRNDISIETPDAIYITSDNLKIKLNSLISLNFEDIDIKKIFNYFGEENWYKKFNENVETMAYQIITELSAKHRYSDFYKQELIDSELCSSVYKYLQTQCWGIRLNNSYIIVVSDESNDLFHRTDQYVT